MAETVRESFVEDLEAAMKAAVSIEPAKGAVTDEQVRSLHATIEKLVAARTAALAECDGDESRSELDHALACVYARSATVAIAGGDEANAARWLEAAEPLADAELRPEITAARLAHERYRALVHGRNRFANGQEAAARAIWKELAREPDKAFADAANTELSAPRPLTAREMPTLGGVYGIGLRFAGSRDVRPDGTYITTHSFSVAYVPLIPIGAYRVADTHDGGYIIFAREQLSRFARYARLAVIGAIVASIASVFVCRHYTDPERLARIHWDDTIEAAATDAPEAALAKLDALLAGDDVVYVSDERQTQVGAEIVRRSASYVGKPFTRTNVDQATRVVRRFEALPTQAQGQLARDAMLDALDGWIAQLPDTLDNADARLALLRQAAAVARADRAAKLEAAVARTKLVVATAKAQDWPLDALAIVAGSSDPAAVELATKIVARLVESPSLLLDAQVDLDTWQAHASNEPLRTAVKSQLELAAAGRAEADAEGVTAAQLVEMQTKRPWDQHVVLALARDDARKDKIDDAAARLAKLGPQGMIVRDARAMLGQLAMARGKLDEADAILSALLASRLPRFAATSAAFYDLVAKAERRLIAQAEAGNLPLDLQRQMRGADEDRQRELFRTWLTAQIEADTEIVAKRTEYQAFADIVPISLVAGSVKVRRAQALSGPARDAMLAEAERTFLAIRTEAEGQPEFRLGLGEIYARLGKATESEAEFKALLDQNDPALSLKVGEVYREIGSAERAQQVARRVFDTAASPHKENAATLLGLLFSQRDDDEAEVWYRKADQSNPFVRTTLLKLEAQRLRRQGKYAECAEKFGAVAKAYLAMANAADSSGYNNASGAYQRQFACNGDVGALREAEKALQTAYRAHSESAVVVGNFAALQWTHARFRAVAKRLDARALRADVGDLVLVSEALMRGSERDAMLADLAADPAWHRSDELIAQFEVLAPNNTTPYTLAFAQASTRRDEAAATAVVERARRAKALDTSDDSDTRAKWISGTEDAKYLEEVASDVARLEAALPTLTGKTRAAAQFLIASKLLIGVYKSDAAMLARARSAAIEAMKLWPALDTHATVIRAYLDEAGLAADAKSWIAERRTRSPVGVLDKLGPKSPIVERIRASAQWPEIVAHARADTTRPNVDDLRFARMVGDADLLAKAQPVLDNKLTLRELELHVITIPSDPSNAEDLALLSKR